jgi:hypothetical protein
VKFSALSINSIYESPNSDVNVTGEVILTTNEDLLFIRSDEGKEEKSEI